MGSGNNISLTEAHTFLSDPVAKNKEGPQMEAGDLRQVHNNRELADLGLSYVQYSGQVCSHLQ